MDNGGFFLIGLFGFFFVMWLLGGGPQNPISSQGLFITAPTTTGDSQAGYGPKPSIDATVPLPANGSVSVHSSVSNPTTKTQTSAPTVPLVILSRSTQADPANPNQKYLEFTITSHASETVRLTGWKFVSKNLNAAAQITSDITVAPGKTILVVTSFPTSASHDSMELIDTNGSVVATASY